MVLCSVLVESAGRGLPQPCPACRPMRLPTCCFLSFLLLLSALAPPQATCFCSRCWDELWAGAPQTWPTWAFTEGPHEGEDGRRDFLPDSWIRWD